jgi:O-antigen biosynthesis protein WbqP
VLKKVLGEWFKENDTFFDFLFSLIGLIFLSPLLVLYFLLVYLIMAHLYLYKNELVIILNYFSLIKFRTMPVGVRSVATHLVKNIKLSSFGYFLRRTKIDEIPQLLNVF